MPDDKDKRTSSYMPPVPPKKAQEENPPRSPDKHPEKPGDPKKDYPPDEEEDDDRNKQTTSEPRDFEQSKSAKKKNINAASSQFSDEETGAVYDASPEGLGTAEEEVATKKPELNPVTKSYKADFPERNEPLQNYAPLVSSVPEPAAKSAPQSAKT